MESACWVLPARRGLRLVSVEDPRQRPSLAGNGVRHDAVRLTPLVVFGQVLGDGQTLGRDEEQAVAVLVLLHLVAGAYPAPLLSLGRRIRIEVTGAERLADLLDVPGEPRHDRLGDGPVGVERRARLLGVLASIRPHLVMLTAEGSSIPPPRLRLAQGRIDL